MNTYLINQDKALCCGCTACSNICPVKCINMIEDQDGFIYPDVNKDKCINCELCKKVCPFNNSDMLKHQAANECYALTISNDDILLNSSSGGAFTAIMQAFCDKNYVIFGAEMCDDFVVRHTSAYSIEEASKFRKSKYVQSDINNSYVEAKKALEDGKKVLFTGTGCQIAGLRGFLQKDYDNLLTVDLVCHGVPSQKLFNKYICSLEKKYKSKVKEITFRVKREGHSRNIKISFENKKQIFQNSIKNIYLRAFHDGIMYMSSCYKCPFASPKRSSDITIADFWGINKITDKFDVSKGVSLVINNTEKGKLIFKNLNNINYIKTDINFAMQNNYNLQAPTKFHANREKFLELARVDFLRAVNKYCYLNFKTRLSLMLPNWIKKTIKRFFKRNGKH